MEDDFARHFSKSSFREKVKELGGTLLEHAIIFYLLLTDKENAVPATARLAIAAGLGYLVLPLDAVPDMIPFLGYSDDLAVLACLLATLDRYITPELRQKAKEQVEALKSR